MAPLVSVIMPAFNAEKYIGNAIYSILYQKLTDLELIIIDDASTDNTNKIINLFSDARIRCYSNKINIGISENRNLGISLAYGKYIAMMDNDDISMPERLIKQVEYLEKNHSVDVVGTFSIIIDDKNKLIGFLKRPVTDQEIKNHIFWRNPIVSPSIMARREWFLKWQYRPRTGRIDDHDLFLRANKESSYFNIPEYLYCYRAYYKNFFLKKYIRAQLDSIRNKVRFFHEYNMPAFIACFSSILSVSRIGYGLLKRVLQPHKTGIRPTEDY